AARDGLPPPRGCAAVRRGVNQGKCSCSLSLSQSSLRVAAVPQTQHVQPSAMAYPTRPSNASLVAAIGYHPMPAGVGCWRASRRVLEERRRAASWSTGDSPRSGQRDPTRAAGAVTWSEGVFASWDLHAPSTLPSLGAHP